MSQRHPKRPSSSQQSLDGFFAKRSCGGATPAAAPTGNSGSDEVAVIPVELSDRTDSHTPPDVEAPVVSEQPEHEEQRTVTSEHSTAAYVKDALSGEKLLDSHCMQLIGSHNGKFEVYNVQCCCVYRNTARSVLDLRLLDIGFQNGLPGTVARCHLPPPNPGRNPPPPPSGKSWTHHCRLHNMLIGRTACYQAGGRTVLKAMQLLTTTIIGCQGLASMWFKWSQDRDANGRKTAIIYVSPTISHRPQSILYIGSGTCHCALFFMFWLLADNRFFHVWRSVTVSPLRKFNWNNSDFIIPTVSCWSGSRSCAATGTLYKNSRLCWLELGLLGCP